MVGSTSLAGSSAWRKSRAPISFRSVNRRGTPSHDPGLQRHHLLPKQLLNQRCFGSFFSEIGRQSVGFDDFRANGLLLPANESTAVRKGMPLHRGPHRRYNEVVIARIGAIELNWSQAMLRQPQQARMEAIERLRLLQTALRRLLLQRRRVIILNRKDPIGTGIDFTELDAMAESIWKAL